MTSRHTKQIYFSHALQQLTGGDKLVRTALKKNVDRIFKVRQQRGIQSETLTRYSKQSETLTGYSTQERTGYSKQDVEIFIGTQDRHRHRSEEQINGDKKQPSSRMLFSGKTEKSGNHLLVAGRAAGVRHRQSCAERCCHQRMQ